MALPVVSGRQVIKALTRAGFEVAGRKGSHVKLKKRVDDKVFVVIVPDHAELARGDHEIDIEAGERDQGGVPEATRGRLTVDGPQQKVPGFLHGTLLLARDQACISGFWDTRSTLDLEAEIRSTRKEILLQPVNCFVFHLMRVLVSYPRIDYHFQPLWSGSVLRLQGLV